MWGVILSDPGPDIFPAYSPGSKAFPVSTDYVQCLLRSKVAPGEPRFKNHPDRIQVISPAHPKNFPEDLHTIDREPIYPGTFITLTMRVTPAGGRLR